MQSLMQMRATRPQRRQKTELERVELVLQNYKEELKPGANTPDFNVAADSTSACWAMLMRRFPVTSSGRRGEMVFAAGSYEPQQ